MDKVNIQQIEQVSEQIEDYLVLFILYIWKLLQFNNTYAVLNVNMSWRNGSKDVHCAVAIPNQ